MTEKGTPRVKTSKFAGAGATAVGAATAAAVLLLGSPAASADPHVSSSASVFAAEGVLSTSPTPFAQSRDGKRDEQSIATLSALPRAGEYGVALTVLDAEAEGAKAQASVAELRLLEILEVTNLRTWCDGSGGGTGGLDFARASVLGTPVEVPAKEETFDVSPLLRLTLDHQERDADSITVTGVTLSVLPGRDDPERPLDATEKAVAPDLVGLVTGAAPNVAQTPLRTVDDLVKALSPKGDLLTITVGSATCSLADEKQRDEPVVDRSAAKPGQAPRPEIVRKNLPVTG